MKDGLSIVVCTNGEKQKSLKNCLRSLNKQSLENKEIICVTTSELSKELKDLVDIVIIEKRRGLSRARNVGIKRAKFKIIAFTDDDCICDINWANDLLKNFTSENIGGVTGRTIPFGKGYPISTIDRLEKKVFRYNNNYEHHHIIGHGNNMCFRKDVLIDIGLFDINFGVGSMYKSADDVDVIYKVLRIGFEIVYSPEALVHHEVSRGNVSLKKIFFDYGVGLGAFCRKYHKDKGITRYFILNILRVFKRIIFFDYESIHILLFHRSGMLKGYLLYLYNDFLMSFHPKGGN